MDIKAVSQSNYKITKVNRLSKARYAKPYSVGDYITFETTIIRTTSYGDNGGNHVVVYKLFRNHEEIAKVTQNELVTVFEIFEVEKA